MKKLLSVLAVLVLSAVSFADEMPADASSKEKPAAEATATN